MKNPAIVLGFSFVVGISIVGAIERLVKDLSCAIRDLPWFSHKKKPQVIWGFFTSAATNQWLTAPSAPKPVWARTHWSVKA